MDNSTETRITLKDCINSLLETEKERNDIKIFLVDNFLTNSWSKQIINLSVGKEKEVVKLISLITSQKVFLSNLMIQQLLLFCF